MSEKNLLKDIAASIQLLSRLPVSDSFTGHSKPDFAQCTWAFPLAGAIILVPTALTLMAAGLLGLTPLVAAIMALTVQMLTTGALQDDGLADVADGFGGGRTLEDKLTIMKDSRVGTFGVIAITLSILLRVALYTLLVEASVFSAILALFASQFMSRAVQVYFWQSLPPARSEGLSQSLGQPASGATRLALTIGFAAAFFLSIPVSAVSSILMAFALTTVMVFAFKKLCSNQINGQTGDTIGAVQIISEIAFLTGLLTFPA